MSTPSLCRLSILNNEVFCCIASPGQISDNRFVFAPDYQIMVPNTLLVENGDLQLRRMCDKIKDFNNRTYVKFRKTELNTKSNLVIPYFKSTEFLCMKCNKIHNGKTEKCCSMQYSPLKITKAELYKIVIPELQDINPLIERAKSDFIDLHFPDIFSTMMLK